MEENNIPKNQVTDEIFQKFITKEGEKYGLKQTVIPSGCCNGSKEFSEFIGTLILMNPSEEVVTMSIHTLFKWWPPTECSVRSIQKSKSIASSRW